MKWLLAGALFAGAPGFLCAQERPPSLGAPAAAAAFTLDIEAPDEIRPLLERHLELLRYRELTDLNDSELQRLLATAHKDTQDLLATLGYFSPDIRIDLQAAERSPGARLVTLRVQPGPATLVREVRIQLNGPIRDDPLPLTQGFEIETSWPLPPGRRFTQAGWDNAKQQALRLLTTQRFPLGQVSSSLADIDPDSQSARLTLTLDSGPAFQLGNVVVSGLQRYDAELVTRLARLTPGADYEQTTLVAAQQRLTDSGYFDSVFVSLDTTGDPLAAPVRVQLRETPLKKLVLGLGASTDSGARLSVEHTHHQVPGIGWRAVSKLSLDRETRSLGTELTAPPDDSNWRWATSVQLQSQQLGSFDVESQRVRAGRSQSGERIDRNYYAQYDRAHSAASGSTQPVVAEALSANYAFTLRNFDTLPFPASGWGLALEVGGGTTLGSQQEPYGRVLARGLSYLPLDGGHDAAARRAGRLALRAEAGAVIARDGIRLPSTQLFLTGGDNSVRGYGYHDLGITLPGEQTTAGRYLAVASVEWQRPITQQGRLTDWEGTLFLDAGAVANQAAALHAQVGVGLGARWKSPVGPLQMDLAYGVATQRFRLHLNVGFSF